MCDKHFSTFTLFPKLPRELRLATWYFALPSPRKIDLGNELSFGPKQTWIGRSYFDDPTARERKHKIRTVFPVTLYVSHESRAETLTHYCIFYYPQEEMLKRLQCHVPIISPLCFDPKRDSLIVDPRDLQLLSGIDWINQLATLHPKTMCEIKEFALHGFYGIVFKDGSKVKSDGVYVDSLRSGSSLPFSCLLGLSGLRSLRLAIAWETVSSPTAKSFLVKDGVMKLKPNLQEYLENKWEGDAVTTVFPTRDGWWHSK